MKKPVVTYKLEAKDTNPEKRHKPELIIAEISAGFTEYLNGKKKYKRVKVSLESTIKPSNFGKISNNYKFDEVIFDKYSKSNAGIKFKISHFEKQIDKLYYHYTIDNTYPTSTEFKEKLLAQLGRKDKEIKSTTTIQKYLKNYIANLEDIKGSGKKNALSEGRIKTYRTLLYYIEKYENHFQTTLTFENLNESTYWDFWDFQDDVLSGVVSLEEVEGKRAQQIKKNGFSINGIIKYQKVLILVCKSALKEGNRVTLDVTNHNLVLKEKAAAKDIFVNEESLIKISNYCTNDLDMKLTKQYVILSSLTGMRYESMVEAHKEKIQLFEDNTKSFHYIHSDQNKTDTECIIPLLPMALETLRANDNKFPQFPDNSRLNQNIKKLFKLAEVSSTTIITNYTFRRDVIIEEKKLDDVITSHDMRKSFYSNLSNLGISQTIIELVTHPNKKATAMASYYDKRSLLNKAVLFFDELKRVKNSTIYKY